MITEEKVFSERAIKFLEFLEKTLMTKSYKIPLLLPLFKAGLKEEMTLKEIGKFYKKFYSDDLHGKDLNNKRHDDWKNWDLKKFEVLAKDNPIHFLTKDGINEEFFSFVDDEFKLNDELFKEVIENRELQENILSRLEYRNINYFRRKYIEG